MNTGQKVWQLNGLTVHRCLITIQLPTFCPVTKWWPEYQTKSLLTGCLRADNRMPTVFLVLAQDWTWVFNEKNKSKIDLGSWHISLGCCLYLDLGWKKTTIGLATLLEGAGYLLFLECDSKSNFKSFMVFKVCEVGQWSDQHWKQVLYHQSRWFYLSK